jgi:hypothetical protein
LIERFLHIRIKNFNLYLLLTSFGAPHPLPLPTGERGRVRGNFKYFSLELSSDDRKRCLNGVEFPDGRERTAEKSGLKAKKKRNLINTNEINNFTPHPPLPLKGEG